MLPTSLVRDVQMSGSRDLQGGLRVVEIENIDINACGGTHLASLAEIQVSSTLLSFLTFRRAQCISPSGCVTCGQPAAW